MQNVKFVLSLFYHLKIFNIVKMLKNRDLKILAKKTKKRKNVDASTFLRLPLEASIGIEPMNQSFADSCLTAWLTRHINWSR